MGKGNASHALAAGRHNACQLSCLVCLLAVALAACSAEREVAAVGAPVAAELNAADGEIQALLSELLQAARQAPDDAVRRGVLGMAYEVNGFAEAAMTSYRQAEALDSANPRDSADPRHSADPRWAYFQALLVAHRGDLDTALGHLARSLAIDADYAAAWLWRGTWLLDLDRLDEALTAFGRAAALGAQQAATIGHARVLLRQGQAAQALDLLQSQTQPGQEHQPYIYQLLGQAHGQLGHAEEARQALAQVTSSGPLVWSDSRSEEKKSYEGSLTARLARARELLAGGQPATALQAIESLRIRYPDHQGLLSTLSEGYRLDGQDQRAVEVLLHGLEVHPHFTSFHLNLADHYIRSGESDRAFGHLQRALELNPEVAWAHAQKGLLLLERDALEAALAAFEAARLYDPANPMAFYYAGMVEASRASWGEAIRFFRGSVQADPEFALGHLALGQSLMQTGQYAAAEVALTTALALGAQVAEVSAARAELAQRVTRAP